MKNNKGVTIVELIVSISLITVVLVFLLRLLLTVKEMDDKSLSMLEYQEKSALIIRAVQEKIKDVKNCNFNLKNDQELNIICTDYNINLDLKISDRMISIIQMQEEEEYQDKYVYPTNALIKSIKQINTNNDNLIMYKIDIYDDKNNNYPIEITYYNK